MSTGLLKKFYGSKAWVQCRNSFFNSKHGLCEECGELGEEVHHKDPITYTDVLNNPAKCYGWDNLKLLCRSCHEITRKRRSDGLSFDENGDIVFNKVEGK